VFQDHSPFEDLDDAQAGDVMGQFVIDPPVVKLDGPVRDPAVLAGQQSGNGLERGPLEMSFCF
jgi:hypothetical protein